MSHPKSQATTGGAYPSPGKVPSPVNDRDTIGAMLQFGGGFIVQLARLYQSTDPGNQQRIRAAWPEYWQKYTELAAHRHAKAEGQP